MPSEAGAVPPLANGEPRTGVNEPSAAIWNTAIESEPWLTANSSVPAALAITC